MMTQEEFTELWVGYSSEIADEFYPKGRSDRRSEYLRDQGILHVKILRALQEKGVIESDEPVIL